MYDIFTDCPDKPLYTQTYERVGNQDERVGEVVNVVFNIITQGLTDQAVALNDVVQTINRRARKQLKLTGQMLTPVIAALEELILHRTTENAVALNQTIAALPQEDTSDATMETTAENGGQSAGATYSERQSIAGGQTASATESDLSGELLSTAADGTQPTASAGQDIASVGSVLHSDSVVAPSGNRRSEETSRLPGSAACNMGLREAILTLLKAAGAIDELVPEMSVEPNTTPLQVRGGDQPEIDWTA